jgi:hypothetical protein
MSERVLFDRDINCKHLKKLNDLYRLRFRIAIDTAVIARAEWLALAFRRRDARRGLRSRPGRPLGWETAAVALPPSDFLVWVCGCWRNGRSERRIVRCSSVRTVRRYPGQRRVHVAGAAVGRSPERIAVSPNLYRNFKVKRLPELLL